MIPISSSLSPILPPATETPRNEVVPALSIPAEISQQQPHSSVSSAHSEEHHPSVVLQGFAHYTSITRHKLYHHAVHAVPGMGAAICNVPTYFAKFREQTPPKLMRVSNLDQS